MNKPRCKLSGENGNIFNLMGIAGQTLKRNNMPKQSEEMVDRIMKTAHSYEEALSIISDYVDIF